MTKNVYKSKNKVVQIVSSIIANLLLAFVITIVFGFATGAVVVGLTSAAI